MSGLWHALGMPPRERAVDRGTRRGHEMVRELGRELHTARLQHGLSQEAVGRAIGLSDTEVGRIERGLIRTVSVLQLSRLLSVVGLELAARAYPNGSPMRDTAQLKLLGRLREQLSTDLTWRTEVPVGPTGSLQAWDAVIGLGAHRVGVEAETRLTDLQAVQRRIELKCRDSATPIAILLLADTRTNRTSLRAFARAVHDAFPVPGRDTLQALRAGRPPQGNSVILI
jgi:transcriptional regulator with XRE-family HTH domain